MMISRSGDILEYKSVFIKQNMIKMGQSCNLDTAFFLNKTTFVFFTTIY